MNAEMVNGDIGARDLRMRVALEEVRAEGLEWIAPLRDAIRDVLPEGWRLMSCPDGWCFSSGADASVPRASLWEAVSCGLVELLDAAKAGGLGELGAWPGMERAAALADALGAWSGECGDHGVSVGEIDRSDEDQARRVMDFLLEVVHGPSDPELAGVPVDEGLAGFSHLLNMAEMEPGRPEVAAARFMRRVLKECAPVISQLDAASVRGVGEFVAFAGRRPVEAARLIGALEGGAR
jgi:hypothetical protein